MWLPAIRLFHEVDQHCQGRWWAVEELFEMPLWYDGTIIFKKMTPQTVVRPLLSGIPLKSQDSKHSLFKCHSTRARTLLECWLWPVLTYIQPMFSFLIHISPLGPSGEFSSTQILARVCVCVLFHCEGVLTHFCISPFIHPSVKTSVFHLSRSILITSFLSSRHQS